MRIPGEAPEDTQVRWALDLAARVGELMLRCGAGAPQVVGSVAAVAAAAGVDLVEVDITLQSLLIQATSATGRPHTLLRVVRRTRHDYARLVAVHELVEAPGRRRDRLATRPTGGCGEIKRSRRIFPVWAVSVASALLASAVAVMIGASALAALATVLVVLAVTAVNRLYARTALPEFYANAINALVATLLAGAVYAATVALGHPMAEQDFAFIVAGGIVAMLPGRSMASAIEDVLFGFPLTGAGRLLSVLRLADRADHRHRRRAERDALAHDDDRARTSSRRRCSSWGPNQSSVVAAVGGALVVGLSGAVTVQSLRRLILPTGLLSVGTAVVAATLGRGASASARSPPPGWPPWRWGRRAAGRGAGSARRRWCSWCRPASRCCPGLTIFRGLYELVAASGDSPGSLTIQSGLTTLLGAGAVLVAIATGTVFGEILASPWDRSVRTPARRGATAARARTTTRAATSGVPEAEPRTSRARRG